MRLDWANGADVCLVLHGAVAAQPKEEERSAAVAVGAGAAFCTPRALGAGVVLGAAMSVASGARAAEAHSLALVLRFNLKVGGFLTWLSSPDLP